MITSDFSVNKLHKFDFDSLPDPFKARATELGVNKNPWVMFARCEDSARYHMAAFVSVIIKDKVSPKELVYLGSESMRKKRTVKFKQEKEKSQDSVA